MSAGYKQPAIEACGTSRRSQMHIRQPPSRPNLVSKIGSHPASRCGSLGIENDQDDVVRPLLSSDLDRLDRDQGCYTVGFFVRRGHIGSTQNRDGDRSERIGEVGQAGAARLPC
jgi:hypothetical protein